MATRNHAVAGGFYPEDKFELSKMVEIFLKRKTLGNSLENIHGLIVPHAGYQYSGGNAGKAYQHIIGKHFSRVIILCPNHTIFLNKIAIDTNDSWKTPLGEVHLDKEVITKLNKTLFVPSPMSHLKEHAIEVQLPFLQKTLPNFKIVPLVVGTISKDEIEKAAADILKLMNHETLLIISTDLSHFLPVHNAEKEDALTIKNILSLDLNANLDACGSYSLKILQSICKRKKWSPKLIEYTNSGKVTGNNSKVVGYASFWF
ncbi:MAG: AmmeMemoRadiSam system protein B [Candidatus Nanoarchaeia archaeon]